jgi:hypothetical protein
VNISANVSDNSGGSGIREVRFTAQWPGQSWRVVYTDSSAPYEYSWDMCLDGVPNGWVELGLDITDNAGNTAYSPTGTRTIYKNVGCGGDIPPPSIGNWTANYFTGHNRWNAPEVSDTSNLRCSRTFAVGANADLDQDYGTGAPCSNMSADTWVGDFTTTVNFPEGHYVFYLSHDDGIKVWVNGHTLSERGSSEEYDEPRKRDHRFKWIGLESE